MHRTDRRTFLAGVTATAGLPLFGRRAFAEDALIAAYNATGQKLHRQFSATPGNIVFSPYSIGTAMAMALAAARGETEREMAQALRLPLSRAEIASANARVIAMLNAYDKSTATPTCPPAMRLVGNRCESAPSPAGVCPFMAQRQDGVCVTAATEPPSARLRVADALMLTRLGAAVSGDYVALLKDSYAAEVFRNAGLDDINRWVSGKTQGKIEKILDQIDPNAIAVLINAVYFKAPWANVFSERATREEMFNLSSSQQVRVPMMRKQANFALVTRTGYRALRIPYAVKELGMIVVLPDTVDGLPAVNAAIDERELGVLLSDLRKAGPRPVALDLPRFKHEFRVDLVPVLREVGITLAFDSNRADFSGMVGRTEAGFAIDQVVHRAVIEVAEAGTEAAAATAAGFRMASAPMSSEPFRVDRPFLYYIVDDATGAVLFQGRVVDPR
jgi:serpin B